MLNTQLLRLDRGPSPSICLKEGGAGDFEPAKQSVLRFIKSIPSVLVK